MDVFDIFHTLWRYRRKPGGVGKKSPRRKNPEAKGVSNK